MFSCVSLASLRVFSWGDDVKFFDGSVKSNVEVAESNVEPKG